MSRWTSCIQTCSAPQALLGLKPSRVSSRPMEKVQLGLARVVSMGNARFRICSSRSSIKRSHLKRTRIRRPRTKATMMRRARIATWWRACARVRSRRPSTNRRCRRPIRTRSVSPRVCPSVRNEEKCRGHKQLMPFTRRSRRRSQHPSGGPVSSSS